MGDGSLVFLELRPRTLSQLLFLKNTGTAFSEASGLDRCWQPEE